MPEQRSLAKGPVALASEDRVDIRRVYWVSGQLARAGQHVRKCPDLRIRHLTPRGRSTHGKPRRGSQGLPLELVPGRCCTASMPSDIRGPSKFLFLQQITGFCPQLHLMQRLHLTPTEEFLSSPQPQGVWYQYFFFQATSGKQGPFLKCKLIIKLLLYLIKFCRNWACAESLSKDTPPLFFCCCSAVKPPMIN